MEVRELVGDSKRVPASEKVKNHWLRGNTDCEIPVFYIQENVEFNLDQIPENITPKLLMIEINFDLKCHLDWNSSLSLNAVCVQPRVSY